MADIQLSSQLFQDIQEAVNKQHPGADSGTVMQYLAAVCGYMLGSEPGREKAAKDEFLKELCGFAEHVYMDLQGRQQQPAPAAPPAQPAFGYWHPPN